ncbi:hypothetical protein [Rufibacter tibetensis]|uniref:Uncharacterized protein n=1 Tax=Rufibacter tibetensis TaxID=512763 RepID=A0A0P0CS38_9BACT|nr:hypothetical protein [Rufibacter tibetensis]ALI97983.1 hypothetical protein DC20_02075 [Rufibacter tibetensis]
MQKGKIVGLILGLSAVFTSTGWAQETSGETTAPVKETQEAGVEQDLRNFKEWVKLQADKVTTTTRSEWPTIKSDFARQANKIEGSFQNLSETSKRDFLELKTRFQELEAKPMADEVPLQAEEVRLREKELLGSFANVQNISDIHMREAYIRFMQNVRVKRQSWTSRDWDYADYILQSLGKRKAAVEEKLTTLDEIKIRSLIGEFYTLRSGQEFKEQQKAKKQNK